MSADWLDNLIENALDILNAEYGGDMVVYLGDDWEAVFRSALLRASEKLGS